MKLYTKTVCPKCMLAKMWIENSDKEVEFINIDHDEELAEKFRKLGIMAAPILEATEGNYVTEMSEIEKIIGS